MIAEDVLERGLHAAAAGYDVPEGAVDRLREKLAPRETSSVLDGPRRLVRSRRAWLVASAAGLVVLLVVAIAIGGGSGSPSSRSETLSPASAPKAPATSENSNGSAAAGSTADGAAVGAFGPARAPAGGGTNSARLPAPATGDSQAKVVKTGEMDLQVDKGQVPHVLDRLTALATLEHGYVADSHSSEGDDASGAVTLRVPAEAFEATLSQVRGLKAKVVSQQTSGEDVTSTYVDLQARIRALSATRATFERLLEKATTINDILAVQSRITDVQTQIEQLQGQLRVLSDKTDYAALTVTVDEKAATTPVKHEQSGLSKALHRSVDRFLGGIEAIIGILGSLLLAALLVAFAVVVGRLGYRRLRRQLV